jgi:DNA-binding NarL/FixJ family response regulator
MPIKVLVADDNAAVRRAIRQLFQQHPEIELVAEATGFEEMIQMMNDLKPQVVVMDVYMDRNSADLTDTVSKLNACTSPIVAISISNDEQTKELAKRLGAVTLLDKMDLSDFLIPTIQKFVSASIEIPKIAD